MSKILTLTNAASSSSFNDLMLLLKSSLRELLNVHHWVRECSNTPVRLSPVCNYNLRHVRRVFASFLVIWLIGRSTSASCQCSASVAQFNPKYRAFQWRKQRLIFPYEAQTSLHKYLQVLHKLLSSVWFPSITLIHELNSVYRWIEWEGHKSTYATDSDSLECFWDNRWSSWKSSICWSRVSRCVSMDTTYMFPTHDWVTKQSSTNAT